MKKLKLFSLATLAVVIGLYSCSKKGDTGATGATGPAGPDSVYYSTWASVDLVGGVLTSGDSAYQQDIVAANLTQGILDSGLVVTYLDYVSTGSSGSGTVDDVFPLVGSGLNEDYIVGNIILSSVAWNSGGPALFYNGYGVRYVIIPGSVLATSEAFKGLTKAQISTMSYNKLTSVVGTSVTIQNN